MKHKGRQNRGNCAVWGFGTVERNVGAGGDANGTRAATLAHAKRGRGQNRLSGDSLRGRGFRRIDDALETRGRTDPAVVGGICVLL